MNHQREAEVATEEVVAVSVATEMVKTEAEVASVVEEAEVKMVKRDHILKVIHTT